MHALTHTARRPADAARFVSARAAPLPFPQPASPAAAPPPPPPAAAEAAEDDTPGLKDGQMTAILTGAVSLIFGVRAPRLT
jgi:hypothetical protein